MRKHWLVPLLLGLALAFGVEVSSAQETKTKQQEQKKTEKKAPEKKATKPAQPVAGADETGEVPAPERRALTRVLRNLQNALEGNSPRQFAENVDERFYDFPRFEDQVTDFLKQNAELRLFLREVSAEVKGDRATLLVDAEMSFATKAQPTAQQKRERRVQFDFVRTAKGWKIYEISPRGFFTP